MRNLWLLLSFLFTSICAQNFEEEINFFVFKDNKPVDTFSGNPVELGYCNAGDKLAVIVHGWRESCSTEWVVDLAANLNRVRGGCIICMDYSYFANNINYFALVGQFGPIRDVLYKRMDQYRSYGLNPSDTHMICFSFGAHLCLQAAAQLGEKVIKNIDACDPAGPGFSDMPDATISAQNVQCIHTSADKGTLKRNCHQNWNMGFCGWSQPAAGPYPKGSHGLCPYFYNSAFTNDFLATKKPLLCPKTERDVYPEGYKMGYKETHTEGVIGTLYSPTSRNSPYN